MDRTPIEENKVIELESDYKPGKISNPTSQDEEFKESPKKPSQKIDRRSITSKLNAIKAREGRARKRAERAQKMKELFGSSESEDSNSDTESASSDSDELVVPSKWSRKKKTKEQREIAELKSMLFKLAEKQKKSRRRNRRNRRERSPVKAQQTPVINYTIAPPIQPQPIEKENKKSTFMDQLLKKRLLEGT